MTSLIPQTTTDADADPAFVRRYRSWPAWRDIHQPYELQWWREQLAAGHSRDDEEFRDKWKEVEAFIHPAGAILDIGCGPRPPFVPCTVIEPLAYEYQKLTPSEWWKHVAIYAQPAEKLIGVLTGKFDTLICWNALDHAIGWGLILDNMLRYGSQGARYAIATDFWPPFDGHPGYPREEFEAEIDKRFTVVTRREPFGRQLALLLAARR